MTKTCEIRFLPDDVKTSAAAGTTVLAAAAKAGVFVNSLCGGDGVCGRCRVIVRAGRVRDGGTEFFTRDEIQTGYVLACQARIESKLTVEVPAETRLAETPVKVEAEVPVLADLTPWAGRGLRLSPLVRKTAVQLCPPTLDDNASDLQRLEQALLAASQRRAREEDAGTRRPGDAGILNTGPGAKTKDGEAGAGGDANAPHTEVPASPCPRVPASADSATDHTSFQMGLKVTRRLPGLLRRSNWKVTAVTGYRGPLTEIIDVEGGDTTRQAFAVAADIGTTTVVCDLLDLRDGQTLGQAAKYNSQAVFGADVIRRIIHAAQGADDEDALRVAIVRDLNELIHDLAATSRLATNDITFISAAGNTTMMHFLLGLPADQIRREPYAGAAYHLPPFRAAEVGLQINPRGLLYSLPCVAGFVGADLTAGILATGMADRDEVRMLIDIGTNGEIVIGNKEFLVCASASAGPAFEGAECKSGMRATRGAIDHIRLLDADRVLNYSTVGSAAPVGLCGTAYVDLVAEMLRVGVIDKTGRLHPDAAPHRVREGQNGELEYVILPAGAAGNGVDLTITQADINNILRAKGAIYAAAAVLLNALHLTYDDLAEILVAGAFGNFLNVGNAVFIGLLPDIPRERLRFVGNTSIAGAKLAALCTRSYEETFAIAQRTTYFELSTDPTFMDQFVSACFFPHTDIERFPRVMAELRKSTV